MLQWPETHCTEEQPCEEAKQQQGHPQETKQDDSPTPLQDDETEYQQPHSKAQEYIQSADPKAQASQSIGPNEVSRKAMSAD